MSLRRRRRSSLRSERGAVLVTFALFAPVAVLFVAFVIDASNSWLHARRLQVQADSAALAAAQEFQPCSNAAVYARAGQYGGTRSVTTASGATMNSFSRNWSLSTDAYSSSLHTLVNSSTFYNQSSTSSPQTPDDTTVADPCNPPAGKSMMVDVKMTETNLPWYVQVFNSVFNGVPYINAQARVELHQQKVFAGVMPISVDQTAPLAGRAYFIDESTNSVIGQSPLVDMGANSQGQEVWTTAAAPTAVAINHNVGVRIALSGDTNNTTCPSTSQLVVCYDTSSSTSELVHIQGWSNQGAGSLTNPVVRSVTLQPGSCSDGYYVYFPSGSGSCTFGIAAKLDLGATPNPTGVTVSGGVTGAYSTLTYQTSGAFAGLWTGTATLTAASSSGSQQIDVQVKCDPKQNSGCGSKATTTTINNVQRIYAAVPGSNSGPIQSAAVLENGVSGADSFEICETGNASCTHNLAVTITTSAGLSDAQKFSDPLYVMRFGSGTSASQTGAVACPPGGQGGFKQSLLAGCSGTYTSNPLNAGWSCPDNALPADCISTDNGLKSGQLAQGFTPRITTPTNGQHYYCPNNWQNNNNGGTPLIPRDDSRVITVFVANFGSFGGSGNTSFPIQTLADFYVTGWDGDPCSSDDSATHDQIVGHFIKYVNTLNTTDSGGGPCTINTLTPCVAVMTR